jgi:hypothetical protein
MNIEPLSSVLVSDRLTQTILPDGTGVVLDIDGRQILTLNATGMYLVEQLRSGADSTGELAERLASAFEVEAEVAQADVEEFAATLAQFLKVAI